VSEALPVLEEARSQFCELGDTDMVALCDANLAEFCLELNDLRRLFECLAQAATHWRTHDDFARIGYLMLIAAQGAWCCDDVRMSARWLGASDRCYSRAQSSPSSSQSSQRRLLRQNLINSLQSGEFDKLVEAGSQLGRVEAIDEVLAFRSALEYAHKVN